MEEGLHFEGGITVFSLFLARQQGTQEKMTVINRQENMNCLLQPKDIDDDLKLWNNVWNKVFIFYAIEK